MERIIDVYYGKDNLPYKDEARTIHFPVAGSEFLGASQTTTIRFHYEQIGTDENVYTVESKRPDGKTGSQLLSKNTTEHYAEMSLSGWYSECKGDLFLSLKVYSGGTTATYNEKAKLWEVNGVPVIESTGAIKLSINYTPIGRYENYNDAISTYQDVLAALGDKLDTIKGIVGVSGLSQVDTTKYDEGQLFFNIDDKALYQLVKGSIVPFLEVYSKSETNDLLDKKADKSTTYTKTEIDDLLTDKQDKLVSGTNIKTLTIGDNQPVSLLGSGTINIPTGGSGGDAEWGSIGGNIADQTDLQNEFQNIREVAEGKCNSYVLNTNDTVNPQGADIYSRYVDGVMTPFSTRQELQTWLNNHGNALNSKFNSQDAVVYVGDLDDSLDDYFIVFSSVVRGIPSFSVNLITLDDIKTLKKDFKIGDNVYIVNLKVPDRWVADSNFISNNDYSLTFGALETQKVNLDNYSTKAETSTEVNKVAHDIATEYDENTLYGSGDLCIKDKLLYKCNTNNTTGTWDSTKWDLTTINSELGIIKGSYVDLTSAQTISGNKNHTGALQKNGVDVATIDQAFNVINASDIVNNTLTQAQYDLITNGKETRIIGNLGNYNSATIVGTKSSGNFTYCLIEGLDGYGQAIIGVIRINNTSLLIQYQTTYTLVLTETGCNLMNLTSINGKTIPTYPSNTGTFVNKMINGTWSWENEIPTSVLLSDGGTISDTTLQGLISRHQPIVLNGFTCYFSCDDGTNYQYVSTRYDAVANKNHINVITINKTTWVAAFHTSDIAV